MNSPCPSSVRFAAPIPSQRNALLAAAVTAALAASAPAQLQFEELPRSALPVDNDNTRALALGDVDGDGDLDLIMGSGGSWPQGAQNRLYLNDGTGRFTDVTAARMPAIADQTRAVALGDLDGDGDLDLLVGNVYYEQNVLLLNDGTGTFTDATAARLPVDNDLTAAVALGDVDGDGDLDAVLGNHYGGAGAQNRLYLNDGNANFSDVTATRMPVVADGTRAVDLGDVDGDGDLDIVFGNTYQGHNRLCLNDGTGVFTDAPAANMPISGGMTLAAVFGDVDGDGDLDIVFGNSGHLAPVANPPLGEQNRLLLNDGSGSFTDVTGTRMPTVADNTQAVVLGDVDGDGDLDITFGNAPMVDKYCNFHQGPNLLYLNNGTGSFVSVSGTRGPLGSNLTSSLALRDIDGDRDLDLVVGNSPWAYCAPTQAAISGQNRLYLNLWRQLHAPVDLQIGQTWALDLYIRHGWPSANDLALPAVSFAPASVPFPPFGTIGIAAPWIVLPPVVIPQPAGVGSLGLPIANAPGLVGTQVYAQALLVPGTLQATLSNVVSDVLQ